MLRLRPRPATIVQNSIIIFNALQCKETYYILLVVPPPSVSDMELEAEARRQFFKEQMEAEDAPQLLLLG